MKVNFSNGQGKVIDYYNTQIDEEIYLHESVVRKLIELKWVDEAMLDQTILEKQEFKIDLESKTWKIETPIPVSYTDAPVIASFCPILSGVISVEQTDCGSLYLCKYPLN
jgi:hypothetical protein